MKLDCKFVEENMIEYIYEESLDPEILAGIKEHLKLCFKCRERVDAYMKIKESAKKIVVNFPEEVWDLHRQEIKKKITKISIVDDIKEKIFSIFNIKKLVFAFLVLLFVFAGFEFVKINQEKVKYKSIIENMELFENISLIEQIDFYAKIKEGDFNL